MKKTKYLVAALLLMGATTTFTSCIDNDEPAGIEELRGAKAELILAKAKVELANEAWVRAKVAEQELINQGLEIANKMKEIQLKAAEIDLKIREAKSEAELAYWKVEKQKWDQELKLQKVQYETLIARAQKELEIALYDLEATKEYLAKLKLVASEYEAQQLTNLQNRVNGAVENLKNAIKGYQDAYNTYIGEVEKTDLPSLQLLEAELVRLQGRVEAWNIVVAEDERLLEKAKDFANVDWNEEIVTLENKVKAAKISLDSAKHAELVYKMGDTYQAAEKSVKEAIQALGEYKINETTGKAVDGPLNPSSRLYEDPDKQAKHYVNLAESTTRVDYANDKAAENTFNGKKTLAKSYYDAVQDSLNAMGRGTVTVLDKTVTAASTEKDGKVVLKVTGFKSQPVDEGLWKMFKENLKFKEASGKFEYNEETGVFSYTKDEYDQATVVEDAKELKKNPKYEVKSPASQRVAALQNWIKLVSDFAVDANNLEWVKKQKEILAAQYTPTMEKYSKVDSLNWATVRDVFVGKTINNVPMSKDFKAALANYNAKYDALAAAIKNYTTDYDTLYTKGYNASVKLTKEKKAVDFLEQVFFNQNGNGGFFYANKAYAYYIVDEGGSKVTKCFINDWNDLKKKKDVTPAELIEKLQKMVAHALELPATKGTANEHFTKEEAEKEYAQVKVLIDKWFAEDNIDNGAKDDSKININYFDMVYAAHQAGRTATWPATKKTYDAVTAARDAFEKVDVNAALEAHLKFANDYYIQELAPGKKKDGSEMTIPATKADILSKMIGTGNAYVNNEQGEATLSKDKKSIVTPKDSWTMTSTRTKVEIDKVTEKITTKRIALDKAAQILNGFSKVAFGVFAQADENIGSASDKDQRILLPTQADIDAYFAEKGLNTREKQVAALNKDFGSFGAQYAYKLELELVDLKLASADKVAPVKEMLEAQLAKLQAEIADNEAKFVTPKVEAAKAAKAAFLEGQDAVKAAKNARTALAEPVEAVTNKANTVYESIKTVYQDLKNTLDAYLGGSTVDGSTYPSKLPLNADALIQHFAQKLKIDKHALAIAQKDVEHQQLVIENFKNGEYSHAVNVEAAKSKLELASKVLDAAQKTYDNALADLNKFMDAMAK